MTAELLEKGYEKLKELNAHKSLAESLQKENIVRIGNFGILPECEQTVKIAENLKATYIKELEDRISVLEQEFQDI